MSHQSEPGTVQQSAPSDTDTDANTQANLTEPTPTGTDTGLPTCLSSATSKLVYLYVRTRGITSVPSITDALNLPTLTVYSILQTLEGYDLIDRAGDTVELRVDTSDE